MNLLKRLMKPRFFISQIFIDEEIHGALAPFRFNLVYLSRQHYYCFSVKLPKNKVKLNEYLSTKVRMRSPFDTNSWVYKRQGDDVNVYFWDPGAVRNALKTKFPFLFEPKYVYAVLPDITMQDSEGNNPKLIDHFAPIPTRSFHYLHKPDSSEIDQVTAKKQNLKDLQLPHIRWFRFVKPITQFPVFSFCLLMLSFFFMLHCTLFVGKLVSLQSKVDTYSAHTARFFNEAEKKLEIRTKAETLKNESRSRYLRYNQLGVHDGFTVIGDIIASRDAAHVVEYRFLSPSQYYIRLKETSGGQNFWVTQLESDPRVSKVINSEVNGDDFNITFQMVNDFGE